ncbi:hypothetical protein NXV13_11075 [Bacteroides ovatus]|nr:hypothetical protein [Bacteroides ovatus]
MKRLELKRQEKRHQKVLGGISDLEVWMKDLVRNGFLNVPERAYTLFDNILGGWWMPRHRDLRGD